MALRQVIKYKRKNIPAKLESTQEPGATFEAKDPKANNKKKENR